MSSVWFGTRYRTAGEQILAAAELGFDGLELSREAPVREFEDLPEGLRSIQACVAAIQVGCRSGDGQESDLASIDETRRAAATETVIEHVPLARRSACSLLTLPGGTVEAAGLRDRAQRLLGLVGRGRPAASVRELAEEILLEAARPREAHLDRLCRSLHAALSREPTLRLGLETPSALHAVLTPGSLGMVFDDLRGKSLAYVHDTARAGILASLGGPPAAEWIERFADRMAAVRLQDHVEVEGGHPPGSGGVDFALVASYTPRRAARILVTDPRFGREALLEGARYLRKFKL